MSADGDVIAPVGDVMAIAGAVVATADDAMPAEVEVKSVADVDDEGEGDGENVRKPESNYLIKRHEEISQIKNV